jgi:hypothetical protein
MRKKEGRGRVEKEEEVRKDRYVLEAGRGELRSPVAPVIQHNRVSSVMHTHIEAYSYERGRDEGGKGVAYGFESPPFLSLLNLLLLLLIVSDFLFVLLEIRMVRLVLEDLETRHRCRVVDARKEVRKEG